MVTASKAGTNVRSEGGSPVVLVAFEPRSYREAIGSVIQTLRPHLEVRVVEPGELGAEVARLAPGLVLCSQPNTFTSSARLAWLEFKPYDKPTAQICVSGRSSELEKVELQDLLSVVDRVQATAAFP